MNARDIALTLKKRRMLGQTGGYTRGRGYPTITGKFSDEMTDRDRKDLSEALSKRDNPKTPKGSK